MGSRTGARGEVWVIVVLAVVAVGLVVYLVAAKGDDATASGGTRDAGHTAESSEAPGPLDRLARREDGDPLALGATDAPVTLVMYSDFRCPFCAKYTRDTEPLLVDRYVHDGVLRIEWRDFPIFGDQSVAAARAGRAAGAQGRFWEFNHAVAAAAPPRGHPEMTERTLIDFAKQAGVPDIARFTAELRDGTHDAAIGADLVEGQSIGVSSTPAFVINGVPVLGAQPLEEFTRVIDAAAARS